MRVLHSATTIKYFIDNVTPADQGIQRGECSHRGADRFLPERDQHRTGAGPAGRRRSGRQSMKSEDHFYQQSSQKTNHSYSHNPLLLLKLIF